eukprot:scaffold38225_cov33-Prasinocladus_malaysianus.AAC.2
MAFAWGVVPALVYNTIYVYAQRKAFKLLCPMTARRRPANKGLMSPTAICYCTHSSCFMGPHGITNA